MTLLTSERDNEDLRKLASALQRIAEEEIRTEKARVLAFAKTLSAKEMVALGSPRELPPTRGDEKRPRHKPTRSQK